MGLIEIAGTRGGKYHVDDKLFRFWNGKRGNILDYLKKNNADRWFIIDGSERIGKTTFAIQQMGAIEPTVFESSEKMCSRICFSPQEFKDTVSRVTNGVVIFDEAFRGLSSRAALSKVNKLIIQTMMEVGQNNNIIFLVLPSFFMLDIYPAMLRGNYLFHIKTDKKSTLRKFVGYNKKDKNKIYQIGLKKGWNYAFETKVRGRFSKKFPGGEEFEKAYLKKKKDALINMEDMANKPTKQEEKEEVYLQRDIALGNFLKLVKNQYRISFEKVSYLLEEKKFQISPHRLGEILDMCEKDGLLCDWTGVTILNSVKLGERKRKVKENVEKMRARAKESQDEGSESINDSKSLDTNSKQGAEETFNQDEGIEKQ